MILQENAPRLSGREFQKLVTHVKRIMARKSFVRERRDERTAEKIVSLLSELQPSVRDVLAAINRLDRIARPPRVTVFGQPKKKKLRGGERLPLDAYDRLTDAVAKVMPLTGRIAFSEIVSSVTAANPEFAGVQAELVRKAYQRWRAMRWGGYDRL